MSELLEVAVSMLAVSVIPSFAWFFLGPEEEDPFGAHLFMFFALGVLLFIPCAYVLDHLVLLIESYGYTTGLVTDGNLNGWAILALFGLGVFIYGLTYKAGKSMRLVWDEGLK